MSENTQEAMLQAVPKTIAFAIDGVVVDILRTDERLAAIFLSQPVVLDVTGEDGNPTIEVGYVYNEETQTYLPESPDPSYVWNEEAKIWLPPLDTSSLDIATAGLVDK